MGKENEDNPLEILPVLRCSSDLITKDGVDMTSYSHFSPAERQSLAIWRREGLSMREIAWRLRRSPSTISRELRRNGSAQGGLYHSASAEMRYRLRRQRSCVLEKDKRLAAYVVDRLAEGWTPDQISGRLRLGLEGGLRTLGVKTIYRWRHRHEGDVARMRRFLPRDYDGPRSRRRISCDRIPDRVPLSARPQEANSRRKAGHWESDFVICAHRQPLLVLHERKTRLTLMTRLRARTAAETVASLQAMLQRLPASMRGSITFDNDLGFARHALLRGLLSAGTFFCDAYASWQKGGVENANGRIRRWLLRTANLSEMEEREIQ